MPWCDDCSRYLTPPSVRTDGTCPTCGKAIDREGAHAAAEDERVPLPWHAKVLALAVALYLGFRAWEGVEWVIDKL